MMFTNDKLNKFLDNAYTVKSHPIVISEINLNSPDTIEKVGVYRYRPYDNDVSHKTLPINYDEYDNGDHYTSSRISYDEILGILESGSSESHEQVINQVDDNLPLLFSLEDCFKQNRPRSGINKAIYFGNRKWSGSSKDAAINPRYYAANRSDHFKYWTSFKKEGSVERGVSRKVVNSYPIDDAVPFVIYNKSIPANRIVVKMQTHVGLTNTDETQKRVPKSWSIEVLRNGTWQRAYSWSESSRIPNDGYVELGYGIVVPDQYKDIYTYCGELISTSMLPIDAKFGDMYLVRKNDGQIGEFWINSEKMWRSFAPVYGWSPENQTFNTRSSLVSTLVDPPYYDDSNRVFREFQLIDGIRIVVNTMNTNDSTFDLIELSPRLVMDWTDRTVSFDVNKVMADLGSQALPVGSLKAGTGKISVNNNDSAFNVNNTFNIKTAKGSIIADFQNIRGSVKFFEQIIDDDGYVYCVPVKTMVISTTNEINNTYENIDFSLRDNYDIFESTSSPELLLSDCSLSRIVMTILDNIGFSNFVFKRDSSVSDPVIPYFFSSSDKSVAEVLNDLAIATQSAMFFDEYNNFVIMTKEYLLPENGTRPTDIIMRGQNTDNALSNFEAISSSERDIHNDGSISFTKRYINRSYGSTQQAMFQSQDKTWVYQPSLLWEVSGDQSTRPINEKAKDQSGYALTAMPLNSDLSADIPSYYGGTIINNTIDVGEAAEYIARYNGYLYADGEIIRYDAVQYAVSGIGKVWIKSSDEYQDHILGLPFGGKIYPTGLIRIYAEPEYTVDENGNIVIVTGIIPNNGRGQFGTKIVEHIAGLNSYWSDNNNVRGMFQSSEYLFNMKEDVEYPSGMLQNSLAGTERRGYVAQRHAIQSTRNGIIKNNLSQKFWSESDITTMTSAQAGTLQSSAFVFAGQKLPSAISKADMVSYVYKPLDNYYTNFGTRCRIIGKVETGSNSEQHPIGSSSYFTLPSNNPSNNITIEGGSGGIGIQVDPDTNNGYFFEIAALTKSDPSGYKTDDIDIESNLGIVSAVSMTDNVVSISVDKSVLETVPSLNIYDEISVQGISEQNAPNVNGTYRVDNITNQGSVLVYTVPVMPYTWINSFGNVSKSGTDLGIITGATVDSNNVGSIEFSYPTGVSIGDTLDITNFSVSGSIPNINKTVSVISVSSDTRTVTFNIPKDTHTFLLDSLKNATVVKVSTQNTKLNNIWFYKTVSDDLGGRITHYTRDANSTTITVDRHRLSNMDMVNVNLPGNPDLINGSYQVVSAIGTTIILNRGGSYVERTVTPGIYNTIGLQKPIATPYRLWSGLSSILIDSGQFWGQYRATAEKDPTVYDLGIEYTDSSAGRRFYLYINNKQIATVLDTNPLQKYNNMALFVRGESKLMFENVFALGENVTNGSITKQVSPTNISQVFGIPDGINESDSLRKYAVSGFVQSSYLSGIGSKTSPQYNMYYDEFGTIMRECEYFNIKYDKAYPVLWARVAPVLTRLKGYTISQFYSTPYGAEFMIFNCLDNICTLDSSTGNYLRINGITFTSSATKVLTVDEYLKSGSKISTTNGNAALYQHMLDYIKESRIKYGKKDFNIKSDYIQTESMAESLMDWILRKVSRPRKNIGLDIFQNPTIQLGDIISIDYQDEHGNVVISPDKQLIIYDIKYSKTGDKSSMSIFATEV